MIARFGSLLGRRAVLLHDWLREMVVEIRTYKLHPGMRDEFDAIFRRETLPLLAQFGIDVVGTAASAADDCHYLLVRAFPSAEARLEQSQAFYGSDAWLTRLDARVMACIDSYHTVVVEDDGTACAGLRAALARPARGSARDTVNLEGVGAAGPGGGEVA